jgi:hypothetical protein
MRQGHSGLREQVTLLRGSLRALARGTPSDRQYQDFTSLVAALLETCPATDMARIRAQTLRVRAKALMAYRRHSFVDAAMGENAVATTLKSSEAVLDALLREMNKAASGAKGRQSSDALHAIDAALLVLSSRSKTPDAARHRGSDALSEIDAALMALSSKSKRH